MFKSLLVPLDGSPLAERALPYLEAVAKQSKARVTIMRATVAHTFPGVDPTDAEVAAVDEAQAYLDGVAQFLEQRGIPADTAVPYGEATEGILDEIRFRGADVVIMATHGRSGLGRWVYGSVAEAVLHESPVPVLLVRAWQAERGAPAFPASLTVLVPLDGSQLAEAALPVAAGLVRDLGGQLALVQAIAPPGLMLAVEGVQGGGDVEAGETDGRAYLEQVSTAVAREHEIDRPIIEVGTGDPADVVMAASGQLGASLVVMATHGRTGIGRLLLGSVTASVLRQSSVPLLVVRPPRLRTEVQEEEEAVLAPVATAPDGLEKELAGTAARNGRSS